MNATVTPMTPGRQSVTELHFYFEQAHQALDAAPGGFDAKAREHMHSKCALFATRLIRAPAFSVGEILQKIEAAEWLDHSPLETLAVIRDDLYRINMAKAQ